MDYFREFYGIISSRPKFLAVIAYKLCPKAQKFHGIIWIFHGNFMEKFSPPVFMTYKLYPKARNFMEKYGLFPGISWKFLQQPGPSLTIAYKPYPRGPEFYGIVWFVYGNFMEKLCLILGYHEASRENLWKIHGFS
jgi:hypothetical protein